MWPLTLLLLLCGLSATLRGFREVVRQAGSSLSVTCHYDAEYKWHQKWWCRGAPQNGCRNRVETAGTEQVVRKDRVIIKDDQIQRRFIVTMLQLRDDDTDTYWCGIERAGPDLGVQVRVTVSPGSAVLKGPGAVTGHVGGSLNVTCQYEDGYERYQKWWCRGEDWSSCRILVQTSGTEEVAKSDRVTIRDDQSQRRFTVTMEWLRDDDADMYWCGIKRVGPDLGVQVRVTVSPANTGLTTTASNANGVPNSPEENAGSPNETHQPNKAGALLSSVHFLLPVYLKAPLLLVLMGAIVWASWTQRGPRKRTENKSQSIEGPGRSGVPILQGPIPSSCNTTCPQLSISRSCLRGEAVVRDGVKEQEAPTQGAEKRTSGLFPRIKSAASSGNSTRENSLCGKGGR